MQSLEYEINTLYTSQGQNAIYNNFWIWTERTTLERCIQKAILQVRMEGIGKENELPFPETRLHIETWREFRRQRP